MKHLPFIFLAIVIVFVAKISIAAESSLSPSEVTVLINRSMAVNPGAPRKSLT